MGQQCKCEILPDKTRMCAQEKLIAHFRYLNQECISLYTNWRFEFSTIYPPPVQIQNTHLAKLSIFYQSMVESLQDFRVILVIALDLVEQIQKQARQGRNEK